MSIVTKVRVAVFQRRFRDRNVKKKKLKDQDRVLSMGAWYIFYSLSLDFSRRLLMASDPRDAFYLENLHSIQLL